MDTSKIDLSKPAFGPEAQKVSELSEVTETSQVEETKEEKVEEAVQETETSVEETETEEQKVPYSRFKKFHERAAQAEREIAELRSQLGQKESKVESVETDVPDYWKELYGDSDASIKAWNIQQRARKELIEEARQNALDAVRSERQNESNRIKENESVIDRNLEALEDLAGRPLTEKEQEDVLNIVDDFTPKDDDGNYLGATIPFEKAWEILELKKHTQKASTKKSRDAVAALTGSPSKGEPAADERDKDFNPGDWNAYKKRLGQ